MSNLYFVTHSEVEIDKDIPIDKWHLSKKGKERFRMFLRQPWLSSIDVIYGSSEQKALDGAEIVSSYLNKPVNMVSDIGEFDRSSTGYQPSDVFMENVKLFFGSPDISVLGWETAKHTQDRTISAIEKMVTGNKNKNILVVAHGGVGSVYLAHLLKEPINFMLNQPGNGGGNYFVVDLESNKIIRGWHPIDVIFRD